MRLATLPEALDELDAEAVHLETERPGWGRKRAERRALDGGRALPAASWCCSRASRSPASSAPSSARSAGDRPGNGSGQSAAGRGAQVRHRGVSSRPLPTEAHIAGLGTHSCVRRGGAPPFAG